MIMPKSNTIYIKYKKFSNLVVGDECYYIKSNQTKSEEKKSTQSKREVKKNLLEN